LVVVTTEAKESKRSTSEAADLFNYSYSLSASDLDNANT